MYKTDSNQAVKTQDVKQHTFAVAKKEDQKNILRTGFLGPCVAFYGINIDHGVAFMSHIDGKICGLKSMVEQLKRDTNGDLQGFSLYLTTNYTFTLRILILVALAIGLIQFDQLSTFTALLFLTVFYLFFGSVVQIYWFSRIRFKTWRVVVRNPWQFSGRVAVSVDASSKSGLGEPGKDPLSAKDSEKHYGTSFWCSDMKPVNGLLA